MNKVRVPRTLEEAVDPARMALLVYDMQGAIFAQAPGLRSVVPVVAEVLGAAREAGVPTFFCRHMSLPRELMGVQALRTAMAWQRVDRPEDVRSLFLRDAPGFDQTGTIPLGRDSFEVVYQLARAPGEWEDDLRTVYRRR